MRKTVLRWIPHQLLIKILSNRLQDLNHQRHSNKIRLIMQLLQARNVLAIETLRELVGKLLKSWYLKDLRTSLKYQTRCWFFKHHEISINLLLD